MAINDLSPAYVKYTIQTSVGSHIMTLPVDTPVTTSTDPAVAELRMLNTSPITFVNATAALWNVLKAWYHVGDALVLGEFWNKPTPESEPTLICDYSPSGLDGVIATTNTNKYGVITFTFRGWSGGRGIFKVTHPATTTFTANKYQRWSDDSGLTAAEIALRVYLFGATTWIKTRKGDFPKTALNVSHKYNDSYRTRAMRLGEI